MSEFFRKSLYRRSPPVLAEVKRVERITAGLVRITFTSDGFKEFPAHCPAAHTKLFLARPGQERPALPALGPNGPVYPKGEPKPIVRTYSVRALRLPEAELDIEFSLHGDPGPATAFAEAAEPGDLVGISYPGGPDPMIPEAERYVLAGDMSAVAAVASILEHLPASAKGHVLLRADEKADVRELAAPTGVTVRWFVGGPTDLAEIVEAFRGLDVPGEGTHFWLGGEHSLVVTLRRHLTAERGVPKDAFYALPYWRHRFDEEGYHDQRDAVMSGED